MAVGLSRTDSNARYLHVSETGVGLNSELPLGLGMPLVAVFARRLHLTLLIEPGLDGRGLSVGVRFPGPVFEHAPLIQGLTEC